MAAAPEGANSAGDPRGTDGVAADAAQPVAEDEAQRRAEAARSERLRRAVEAYRATVRNEAAPGAPGSSGRGGDDDRLLADRPPHWQPKSPLPPF